MNEERYQGMLWCAPKWALYYVQAQEWFPALQDAVWAHTSRIFSEADKTAAGVKVSAFIDGLGFDWIYTKDHVVMIDLEPTPEITMIVLRRK